MIKSIKAENYKSIKSLELELGRVNVFIGENGAGKSNILEVFALAGAAVASKLDNEFLSSRGIRVVKPEFMRPAFLKDNLYEKIILNIFYDGDYLVMDLRNNGTPYSGWEVDFQDPIIKASAEAVRDYVLSASNLNLEEVKAELNDLIYKASTAFDKVRKIEKALGKFIIFSPENSALKIFNREGQIEPLGINGEGLLKLLSVLEKNELEVLQEIKSSLQVLGWFEDFKLVDGDTFSPSRIAIKDRYIEDTKRYFDQMSANEGFLFLLFYFALFSTKLTPSIFAIDNIDASLNPALCEKLVRELVKLAKKHDKQVLLTTHNPATLDGLNLDDDEQRLFVVSRGKAGETKVRRLEKKVKAADKPIRLSEMFLRGSLGGLPKGF